MRHTFAVIPLVHGMEYIIITIHILWLITVRNVIGLIVYIIRELVCLPINVRNVKTEAWL